MTFIQWIKNMYEQTHGCTNCYNFLGSAVLAPMDLLLERVRSDESVLARRLGEPSMWGHPTLMDVIAKKYGIADQSRILVTSGGSSAIYLIYRTLLAAGDHVIVESPCYDPFLTTAAAMQVKAIALRRVAPDFQVDLAELESLITPQTKLIVLTNLHNPGGVFLETDVLRGVAMIAHKYHVKVLVDEVFHDFVVEKQPSAATLDDHFISLNSLSKVYGVALLRCGWILAAPDVIESIRAVQIMVENVGSVLTQALASMVLEHADDYRKYWSSHRARNRQIVQETLYPLLQEGLLVGNIPADSCIFFPQIVGTDDTTAFTEKLADHDQVYVVPGHFFGLPAHVRIGFGGATEELEIGLQRLVSAIRDRRCRDEC
jgi:aspartate/methionine/tyrosine aminotransferase